MRFEELVNVQIRLEYRVDGAGMLVPFPDSSEQAWFIGYASSSETIRFYRHDLPPEVHDRLEDLDDRAPFEEPFLIAEILGERVREEVFMGSVGTIPAGGLAGGATGVRLLGELDGPVADASGLKLMAANLAALAGRGSGGGGDRPVVGAFVGDRLVSICESSRENDAAAEAWVRTSPGYRRAGFGRSVAAGWADAVRERGKVPLYSYRADNRASAALLRSLGGREIALVAAYG